MISVETVPDIGDYEFVGLEGGQVAVLEVGSIVVCYSENSQYFRKIGWVARIGRARITVGFPNDASNENVPVLRAFAPKSLVKVHANNNEELVQVIQGTTQYQHWVARSADQTQLVHELAERVDDLTRQLRRTRITHDGTVRNYERLQREHEDRVRNYEQLERENERLRSLALRRRRMEEDDVAIVPDDN